MNKKFYKVLSFLVATFLISCQVSASAALEEYKDMSVYRYQVPDEGDNSDDDDSDSGDQNVVEDKSVDGIPPAESATVDGEEPKSPLDVPLAVSAPATGPVSSSSSSSSSSAAASVDVSKSRQCMTIEQWENASMSEVLDDMGVFKGDPKSAITDAETRLLNKLYCDGKYNGPHVAVARLLFLIADKTFWALNLPCVFISGTNSTALQFLDENIFIVTINPYTTAMSGAEQSFAHSERAVGVYLLNQVKTNKKIKKIVRKCECKCVIIQIKCALPPCRNCIKFWNGTSCVSEGTCIEPEVKKFCSETAEGAKETDWLGKIRASLCPGVPIGVNISCCGSVTSRCVFVKSLFERLLKSGDGENEKECDS